jgi:DNA repair photolyase
VSFALPIHGRGSAENPRNRFEAISVEADDFADCTLDDDRPAPATIYLKDTTRVIIATNDSPDVGFDASVNIYRGCEHGCIYCFARPTHEYLGFSAGLDFETRIMVKTEAPKLLRKELAAKSWRPRMIAMSGVTDCYQPIERKLQLTRQCLAVLAECRNPVGIITKNHLVTRDADLLAQMASWNGASVFVSITTLDPHLSAILEPRASSPHRRLEAVAKLSAAGVPVGVMMAPVIPGLNDVEMPALLKAIKAAGARWAGFTPIRLPYGVADLFQAWLARHYPDRQEKILNAILEMRSGRLNDPVAISRMRGKGPRAEQFAQLFKVTKRRVGLDAEMSKMSTDLFRPPRAAQGMLFESYDIAQ